MVERETANAPNIRRSRGSEQGRTLTAKRKGPAKDWKLLLVGEKAVSSVKGGKTEKDVRGTLIAAGDGDTLTCTLAELK